MWDILLDALIDSLKVLAVLLVVNVIIALLESRVNNTLEKSKRWTPFVAVGLATLPQCGFSVVATDLYVKRHLSLGTLLGVYIATSDEALPILLANPDKALSIIPLLAIKLVVGIAVVYIFDAIFRKKHEDVHEHVENCETHTEELHTGCCKHQIEDGDKVKQYVVHPLVHSLKLFAYILIINIILGFIIDAVGEDTLSAFMDTNRYVAPLFAVLVGLIPNCASSVLLTNMYISMNMGFGACVGGLCANAGLGLMVLFRDKHNVKRNLCIVGILIGISLIVGYVTSFVVWAI